MKQKHTFHLLSTFFGLLLATSSLSADAPEETPPAQKLSKVDSRPLSAEKLKMVQQQRAIDFREREEQPPASTNQLSGFPQRRHTGGTKGPAEYVYPLNSGWLNSKTTQQDVIAMGDGSQWKVNLAFIEDLRWWQNNDTLVISPVYDPFATYNYWIKNTRTGGYVQANLFLGSEEYGAHSHRVVSVEHGNARIILENRVYFEVHPHDAYLLEDWEHDDTVILGDSNTWFTPYTYILINVHSNHFVRAKIL